MTRPTPQEMELEMAIGYVLDNEPPSTLAGCCERIKNMQAIIRALSAAPAVAPETEAERMHRLMNTPIGPVDGSGDWEAYRRKLADAAPQVAPAPLICCNTTPCIHGSCIAFGAQAAPSGDALREDDIQLVRELRALPGKLFADAAERIESLSAEVADAISIANDAAALTNQWMERADKAESALAAQAERVQQLEAEVARYWPYVEAVAHKRYPFTMEDEIEACEMVRERKRAALAAQGGRDGR